MEIQPHHQADARPTVRPPRLVAVLAEARRSGLTWNSAVLVSAAVIVASTVLALAPAAQRWSGDVRLYEHYAGLMFTGVLGHTPFFDWYPPLSLLPLGLPLLAGTGGIYVFTLGAEMAAVAGAGFALVRASGTRLGGDAASLPIFAALTISSVALYVWRFDMVPAVLTILGLASVAARKHATAGAAFGFAAGLKLYAIPLLPLLALWAWRQDGRAAFGRTVAGSAAAGAISIGLVALFPGSTPLDQLTFTASRPLHIESVLGSLIALAGAMGSGHVNLSYGSGSFNLDPTASAGALGILRFLQPIAVGAVTLVALGVIARRSDARAITLVHGMIAVLLSTMILHRVLSPQYLIWLLPMLVLVAGALRWTLASALIITVIYFPWLYDGVVALDSAPLMLIVLRNGLLTLGLALALRALILAKPDTRGDSPDRRR